MNFIIAAGTDAGNVKETNQDSFNVKVLSTPMGKMAFAVVCDGMGGLSHGELASASVVHAFNKWVTTRLPVLSARGNIEDYEIKSEWFDLLAVLNGKIHEYGRREGVTLGTTVTAALLTQYRYYIVNVGDTRAYELDTEIKQITTDHTLLSQEISKGNLTEEEAEKDERRNVLLQGIGASDNIYPDMFFGPVSDNGVYMLCSDGFRHELSKDEIFNVLRPENMLNAVQMKNNIDYLISVNKEREESDNITCVAIRTF